MKNPTTLSASAVADFFVKEAIEEQKKIKESGEGDSLINELERGISNLKLQKIMYYAQAAHLSIKGTPLFNDEIKAWPLGPVIPSVYEQYKRHGGSTIENVTGKYIEVDDDTAKFLKEVWKLFGKYSASQLVDMTHKDAPWRLAIKQEDKTIKIQEIQEYYKGAFSS